MKYRPLKFVSPIKLFIPGVMIACLHFSAYAAQSPQPRYVRSLGVGISEGFRVESPGFESSNTLLFAKNSINGPIRYLGPDEALLEVINSGQPLSNVNLGTTEKVLIVGIQGPDKQIRFLAVADEYGSKDERMVSLLNLTRMRLYIKLDETEWAVSPGKIARESFPEAKGNTRLRVSLVGEYNGSYIPIINNRLKILSRRDVLIIITNSSQNLDSTSTSNSPVNVDVVYLLPQMLDQPAENSDSGGSTVMIKVPER